MTDSSDVARYYDRSTRRFLFVGQGGSRYAIRRAVWGPGVSNRPDAFEYGNSLILRELESIGAQRVVDLGCGVGGSMIYLERRLPAEVRGVTISSVQAELGNTIIRRERLHSQIAAGDYTEPGFWERSPARHHDALYAIESLVHVGDPAATIALLANQVRSGGRIIIIDDVVSANAASRELDRREARLIREFIGGWHARGLSSIGDLVVAGAAVGATLVEARDLTPYLELDRPRDLLTRAVIAATRWWPWGGAFFQNMLGGNALQVALKRRLLRYVYLVFEVL